MSNYSDFVATIKQWAARPDYSDLLVDGFMRSAETNLSRTMRVKEMLALKEDTVTTSRFALPLGWREIDYVRLNGGEPLNYLDRESFFKETVGLQSRYTIVGNNIHYGFVIDEVNGNPTEISYYDSVPHLSEGVESTWLFDYYHDIYLQSCLVLAYLYGEEQDRALNTSNYVSQLIGAANEEHVKSKTSGSTLRVAQNRGRIR